MLEEISLLKQRLFRCEKANKDLMSRFFTPSMSEKMKSDQNPERRQRVSINEYSGIQNDEEIDDSPRGGYGSNYVTNTAASKMMKP